MTPIITSLLDLDYYKLTMGQIAWKHDTDVEYTFFNRTTETKLAEIIPLENLREQLHYITTLKFTYDELEYLRDQHLFGHDYLAFLRDLSLPHLEYINITDGQFDIRVKGKWGETILWETLILSAVNELLYKHTLPEVNYEQAFLVGRKRLTDKITRIRDYNGTLNFTDFGTRRRFSKAWHEEVIRYLTIADLGKSKFLGTSNVYLAKKFGIKPVGTFAHELPMIFAGMNYDTDANLKVSHNKALEAWKAQYGDKLAIALTDTYGSEFFFNDLSHAQSQELDGYRQDSGPPLEDKDRAIQFCKRHDVSPLTKTIVFSDGLDLDKMMFLNDECEGRIGAGFGWGTNLTNDLGADPVSIVVKATKANGNDLVKLSNNISKAVGPEEAVKRFKRVFNYECNYNEKPIY